MASAGIDPDKDVRLIVVPPPQMIHYLRAGVIAGYCVGEPWNTLAVNEGIGRILVNSHDIWNNHPEKVLGTTRIWAQTNPNTHKAVVKALLEACRWLETPENRTEACELLSSGRYVNAPKDVLEKSLSGTIQVATDLPSRNLPDFNVFHRYASNFPWRSHAVWFITQMLRWGQLEHAVSPEKVAKAVYRPEVFRAAASELGIKYPEVDFKTEGGHEGRWALMSGEETIEMGPDLFIDGRTFDSSDVLSYLEGFEGGPRKVSLESLESAISGSPREYVEKAG
jgi:nitrate/nitrite transport system substrate-binding protein